MTDLRFIADEQLRNLVERDKRELDSCLKNQLCKSTLLLAGSIIEAILVDFSLAFPRPNTTHKQVLGANLATLIDWAEQEGLITARTKELSTVIKNYRNLIHPGREYRLKERVDIHTATVAANLVEIVILEVGDNYAKRLGYTAEQAIQKVRLDPSCSAIFQHMIDKMAVVERVKLFRTIPDVCRSSDDVSAVVESLIHLHNLLKGAIPKEIARAEAVKVYTCTVHSSSQAEAMFYFRFFVRDLDMLENDQKEAVIVYLLGILEQGSQEELELYEKWEVFNRLGGHLDSEEGIAQLKNFIQARVYEKDTPRFDAFLSVLCGIVHGLDRDRGQSLANELREDFWNGGDKRDLLADFIEKNLPPLLPF